MSWSDEFKAKLADATFAPIWAIEVLVVDQVPSVGGWWACSHNGTVVSGSDIWIADRGVNIQGQRLSCASWTSSVGAFTVDLTGNGASLLARVTRGTWLRVWMGFAGWGLEKYEPIAIGVVKNIRATPPVWTVECWDWASALRGRQDPADPDLFTSIGSATSLNGAYTGLSSPMTVLTTTSFDKESSGSGAIVLSSSLGESCVYTWGASTATTFTIANAKKFGTDGTVGGADTDTVTEAAYLTGHPLDIARKVLCSTGTAAANGTYDTLPRYWAYGLPDALMDHDDMDRSRDKIMFPATGAYTCDILVTEAQPDGGAWMLKWLTPLGCFFATRQGKITVRPVFGESQRDQASRQIVDTDILVGPAIEWEGWDADYSEEWSDCIFSTTLHDATTDTATSSDGSPATLPAVQNSAGTVDTTAAVRDLVQGPLINDELALRLGETRTRVPERLTIVVRLTLADLCPGDLVYLSLSRIYGRELSTDSWGGYAYSRYAIVTEVTPDWHGASVRLTLAVFPTSSLAWAS